MSDKRADKITPQLLADISHNMRKLRKYVRILENKYGWEKTSVMLNEAMVILKNEIKTLKMASEVE